ncbi:MAG: flavodoxin-dependent (E)-4-hydroxy-3-methylbut-2-enyl-diphosphate synthase [Saccharofermentanales bacterium]
MYERKKTRIIRIGNVMIGGDHPIAIQSMNNTLTSDAEATLDQIHRLAQAGCDITRVAVPDMESAKALKIITARSPIPVVADIHYDYRLALEAIRNNAAKIRINPGNIGDKNKIKAVADAARSAGIPIRVGVNSGSVNRDYLAKYGSSDGRALTESALDAIAALEAAGFYDMVVSVKSSDPLLTIKVYRLLAERTEYPFHLGVTEAGTPGEGAIRSAVGIGTLLAEGIGDTIRVSLTGDPVLEVECAMNILKSLKLRQAGAEIISCPTCGRTSVDLIKIAEEAVARFKHIKTPIKIAIMGCPVNGPGEARDADIGIAGGKGEFLLFEKGRIIRKIPEASALDELEAAVNEYLKALGKEN